MLTPYSIKHLYPLALAEGEGVGTAYEYFAKRLVLGRWLPAVPRVQRLLVAGLPEKYGASLDMLLLAAELAAEVVVVDDRPEALERNQAALAAVRLQSPLNGLRPRYQLVADLVELPELADESFDLALSSEVLQRLGQERQPDYVQRLGRLASHLALFAPNGDNAAHTEISGLTGLSLATLRQLATDSAVGAAPLTMRMPPAELGYIDLPPFPPGITRSAEQREQATSGRLEGFMMWVLGLYARLERLLPQWVRRRHAHIVYALL